MGWAPGSPWIPSPFHEHMAQKTTIKINSWALFDVRRREDSAWVWSLAKVLQSTQSLRYPVRTFVYQPNTTKASHHWVESPPINEPDQRSFLKKACPSLIIHFLRVPIITLTSNVQKCSPKGDAFQVNPLVIYAGVGMGKNAPAHPYDKKSENGIPPRIRIQPIWICLAANFIDAH